MVLIGGQAGVAPARPTSAARTVGAVAVLLALVVAFAWDRSVFALALPEIRATIRLTPHEVGLAATVFTAGIALGALPAGWIARRVGSRAALAGGALMFSAATAYAPAARGFGDLLVSRVLVGFGDGVFNVTLLTYLANLSDRRRAALIGLAATVYGLGAATGPPAVDLFNRAARDWRTGFYVLAATGVALCLPLVLVFRDAAARPTDRASATHRGGSALARLGRYWPLLLLVGAQGVALYSVFGLLPAWTRAHFGFSPAAAALALGAAGLGMVLGGAPMGLVADRLGRAPCLIGAGCVGAASAIALMAFDLGPVLAVAAALVFGAAAQTVYVTVLAMAQDGAGEDAAALVGLIVTVFYGAASVSGLALIRASEWFGYRLGAIVTYALLYGVGLSLFAARQGRMPRRVREESPPRREWKRKSNPA